jgi:hypothetical protein
MSLKAHNLSSPQKARMQVRAFFMRQYFPYIRVFHFDTKKLKRPA